MTPAVALVSVTVKPDLVDVSLSLHPGERVAVVSAPDAGRRLLEIIAGSRHPDAGSAAIAGTPVIGHLGSSLARARVQTVSTAPRSVRAATVADSLQPAARHARARAEALPGTALSLDALVNDMLERVGLAELADRRPQTLPLSQRYTLDLAWAILHRPDVLLLERPTAVLTVRCLARLRTIMEQLPEHVTIIATVDDPGDERLLRCPATILGKRTARAEQPTVPAPRRPRRGAPGHRGLE